MNLRFDIFSCFSFFDFFWFSFFIFLFFSILSLEVKHWLFLKKTLDLRFVFSLLLIFDVFFDIRFSIFFQKLSYSRFYDFLKNLTSICYETNMVGTPHTRFDSFYITWPPLHIPIAPRAPKYRFSKKTDQDEGFFTLCQKNLKNHLKWVKMGPLRLRIYFLGYFDMAISVLILPDSLDNVFGSFLRISWPKNFPKIADLAII